MEIPITGVYLGRGGHSLLKANADGEFCAMEYLALVLGYKWTYLPACTAEVISRAVTVVNDNMRAIPRQAILDRLERIAEAAPIQDPGARERVERHLAIWAIRYAAAFRSEATRREILAILSDLVENRPDIRCALRQGYPHPQTDSMIMALTGFSDGDYEYSVLHAVIAMANDIDNHDEREKELLDFLDELLDQYEKARVEEGVMCEEAA